MFIIYSVTSYMMWLFLLLQEMPDDMTDFLRKCLTVSSRDRSVSCFVFLLVCLSQTDK